MLSRRSWPTLEPALVFREAAKLGGPRRTVIHPADFWDRDGGILCWPACSAAPILKALFADVGDQGRQFQQAPASILP
jgi:hypothetical protein